MGRKSSNEHKIIVVGLPPGSTNADLHKLVKPVGNPLNASMAVDADGKERGFGFVQFNDAATQQAAIAALDKSALAGRTLNVRAVEERAPGSGSGSGGARPAGGNRGRPCYDFARGKCARGASCRWAHVAPPSADDAEAVRSRRPEWQKKRPGADGGGGEGGGGGDASSSLFADIPEDICRKYQLGTCHRGEACRWRHVIWKKAGGGGEANGEASAGEGAVTPAAKKAKTMSGSGGDGGGASGAGSSSKVPMRIGGDVVVSPAAQAAELRGRLRQREVSWREGHPEHPEGEEVPMHVKRRDVVWRALERQLERAALKAEAEAEEEEEEEE